MKIDMGVSDFYVQWLYGNMFCFCCFVGYVLVVQYINGKYMEEVIVENLSKFW